MNNHTFNTNKFTNYKITIKTNPENIINLLILEDSFYGSIVFKDKSLYTINYYNDNLDKITVQCKYDNSDYTIDFSEESLKIQQIYMNKVLQITFLHDIQKQYNLRIYDNDYEPSIFYGLMNDADISALEKNKSLKIIVWIGGDINFIINRAPNISRQIKNQVERILRVPKIKHVSISSFITKSLTDLHLPFKFVPFMGNIFPDYKAVTKGPCIYLYTSLGCEQYYGNHYYIRLMQKYANIRFIVTCHYAKYQSLLKKGKGFKYGIKYYTKKQLINEIYPQCFIGLRLTDHDGLSGTVQELGLMGIKSVHNGCSPSSLNYKSFEDICSHIDREIKTIGTADDELATSVRNYLTIDLNFFNTEFYK